MNKEKGELTSCVGHNNLQLGYTLTNHLFVFTSGKFRNTRENIKGLFGGVGYSGDNNNDYQDEAFDVEVGSGFFKHFGLFTLETLAGTGFGKLDYVHTVFTDYDYADYLFKLHTSRFKLYLQQNIGVTINNYVEVGISAKLIKYYWYDIKSSVDPGYNSLNVPDDSYFIGRKTSDVTFFEPGLTVRGGLTHFKAQMQVVPVFNLTNSHVSHREISLFLSFSMNLNVLKHKSEKVPQL